MQNNHARSHVTKYAFSISGKKTQKKPEWHQRLTKAARLGQGCLPRSQSESTSVCCLMSVSTSGQSLLIMARASPSLAAHLQALGSLQHSPPTAHNAFDRRTDCRSML
jgi:hypothetical protein